MTRKRATTKQKAQVRDRASGLCEYCRCPELFSTELFSVEHIYPISREGKTELKNLALSCMGCNGHKYTKIEAIDPASGKLVDLFHPRKQLWQDHFEWGADFLEVIGITPEGRANPNAIVPKNAAIQCKAATLLSRCPILAS